MAGLTVSHASMYQKPLTLIQRAMDLLDAIEAPPHITAHLEYAIAEIQSLLASQSD